MFIGIKRLILTITFLALIITNILTLTNAAFNAALSGLIGTALGIKTVSSLLQDKITTRETEIKKQKASAADLSRLLVARVKYTPAHCGHLFLAIVIIALHVDDDSRHLCFNDICRRPGLPRHSSL